jgi:hypothetical protein
MLELIWAYQLTQEGKRMTVNKTGYKALDRLAGDYRVEEIWTENDGFREDGLPSIWLSFHPGWHWDDCSTLHEYNCEGIKGAFKCIQEGNGSRSIPDEDMPKEQARREADPRYTKWHAAMIKKEGPHFTTLLERQLRAGPTN